MRSDFKQLISVRYTLTLQQTGIYYINPNVLQGPQESQNNPSGKTLQSGLAVTIQSASGSSNTTNSTSSSYGLWYNTNGANYSGNYALGYDVRCL